jgi:glucosyl-3-phosphoglycerate synthase
LLPETKAWLAKRTSTAGDWPVERLLAAKGAAPGGGSVSVVLPARNERETVGGIVAAIRRELVERTPLVDEIVVIDSRSTDDTAAVAAAAGADVVAQDEVLPWLPPLSGKGEALWKSLAVTSGDLIVFIDADLRNFTPAFVTALLGPLLTEPAVAYVKACYDRPYLNGPAPVHGPGPVAGVAGVVGGGGRVTELVARPLINLHWPLLAGVMQPLGGEYAGRRTLLERLPFVTGYGVELGLLLDVLEVAGLDALAQVDLGRREHSHQSTEALGAMSSQIMLTAWSRLERYGRIVPLMAPETALAQFRRAGDGHDLNISDIQVDERPPMLHVPDYAARARQPQP